MLLGEREQINAPAITDMFTSAPCLSTTAEDTNASGDPPPTLDVLQSAPPAVVSPTVSGQSPTVLLSGCFNVSCVAAIKHSYELYCVQSVHKRGY